MTFRVSASKNHKYYYALSKKDATKVRIVGVLGLLSLPSLALGMYYFVHTSIWLMLLFLPFFVVILLYNLINYGLITQYKGFSLMDHLEKVRRFLKDAKYPRVAVMIPAAGEDIHVVRQTMNAALKIQYPNYRVFVLDDSKNGLYRDMVTKSGAAYFRRHNRGHHKKAGNLNALLEHIEGYEHILVLDADFVPKAEILNELLPYTGPDVSIVQSPQDFRLDDEVYKRSKFEYGAGLIQRDFYRVTQVARNSLGGAICVGTNALYNVKAIKQVGGYEGVNSARDWGHSEDVFTGLKTLNTVNEFGKRYRIEYVPIALARGTCPDDHLSFYKQQNRWASGSMQLIFSKMTLFSKSLTLSQKFCYFSNSVYYFYTISLLLSPLQLLALTLTGATYTWLSTLLFAPSVIIQVILMPYVMRRPFRPIAASVVVISNAYTFIQALILLVIKRPLGWEATGAKSKSKRHTQFTLFKFMCTICFMFVYLLTFALLVVDHRIGLNPSIVIVTIFIVSFISHLVYLHHMYLTGVSFRKAHTHPHTYSYAFVMTAVIVVLGLGYSFGESHVIRLNSDDLISVVETTAETKLSH